MSIPSVVPSPAAPQTPLTPAVSLSAKTDQEDPESYTNVLIHNVIIHTKERSLTKIKWMRARMYPIKPGVVASFDDLSSFRLEIVEGLLGRNVSDLAFLLRNGALKHSALKNLKIEESGGLLKMTGTLQRFIPLPVQLMAEVSPSPDHQSIRLHTVKLSALKIPLKGMLGMFHIHTADVFSGGNLKGLKVSGDTIDIDVSRLVPEPHVHGTLTEVHLWKTGDLMEYYGKPREDALQVSEWRNFMRMRGGTLNFGKLTMHNADLLLVDTSKSDWLSFDVAHYQEQLVNGETHITPSAGLQIFIPDINKIPPSKRNQGISLQWMKDRNLTPPPDIP